MGCLRITYSEEESPLRISREEKTDAVEWGVYVAKDTPNLGVVVVAQASGGDKYDFNFMGHPVDFSESNMGQDLQAVADGIQAGANFVLDAAGGAKDFVSTYNQMRDANHINSDKYFHAKANFLAASRGEGGEWIAEKLSNLREASDMSWPKYDTRQQSMADQRANMFGRSQSQSYDRRLFVYALQKYRPATLPHGY